MELPHSLDPNHLAFYHRIGRDAENHLGENLADGMQALQAMSMVDQEQAVKMIRSTTTQQAVWQTCVDAYRGDPNSILEQAADLLSPHFFETLGTTIEATRLLTTLVNQLDDEEQARQTIDVKTSLPIETQVSDYVRSLGMVPVEAIIRWSTVSKVVLYKAGYVLDYASLTTAELLPQRTRRHIYDEVRSKSAAEQQEYSLLATPIIVQVLLDSRIDRQSLPPSITAPLLRTYPLWRRAKGIIRDVINIPDVAERTEPVENMRIIADGLQQQRRTEVEKAIAGSVEKAQAFRPPWSQLQEVLRPFATELLRPNKPEDDTIPIANAAQAKRLTGILHVLEQLGSGEPEAMYQTFAELIDDERDTNAVIAAAKQTLQIVKTPVDLPKWLSVTDDLNFLHTHWRAVQAAIGKSWPSGKGRDVFRSVAAISRAIHAYDNQKHTHWIED